MKKMNENHKFMINENIDVLLNRSPFYFSKLI